MIISHLLPNARAWRITVDKQLRQFMQGLGGLETDAVGFLDDVYLDLFPGTTRELTAWDDEFGLRDLGLSDDDRRLRLAAAWQAVGGQSPRYIEDTLRQAGFNVYVHDWWEPGTEPDNGVKACVTPRNPLLWLRREYVGVSSMVDCGEALAACGEVFAEAGNRTDPPGYPLVNKVFTSGRDVLPLCGEALAECGEDVAQCGNYTQLVDTVKQYTVPLDSDKWPYFIYIGGETFGTLTNVDPRRKEEFEALCLKICPLQLWIGLLVEYIREETEWPEIQNPNFPVK